MAILSPSILSADYMNMERDLRATAEMGVKWLHVDIMDGLFVPNLSFGYSHMPKQIAQAIVDSHGPDKLLFASDMPWHRPEWELRLINSLDISESDREKIFFRNAQKLLNLL